MEINNSLYNLLLFLQSLYQIMVLTNHSVFQATNWVPSLILHLFSLNTLVHSLGFIWISELASSNWPSCHQPLSTIILILPSVLLHSDLIILSLLKTFANYVQNPQNKVQTLAQYPNLFKTLLQSTFPVVTVHIPGTLTYALVPQSSLSNLHLHQFIFSEEPFLALPGSVTSLGTPSLYCYFSTHHVVIFNKISYK